MPQYHEFTYPVTSKWHIFTYLCNRLLLVTGCYRLPVTGYHRLPVINRLPVITGYQPVIVNRLQPVINRLLPVNRLSTGYQ